MNVSLHATNSATAQLPLMEAFYTVQGEGFFQGEAAYFIRLGGCEVGCVWCDVKESWDVNAHPKVAVPTMVVDAKNSGAKLVVVTGGEPLMHDLTLLTQELKSAGLRTNIETAGVYPVTGEWDWICLSPKKFMVPHLTVPPRAHELKVVVYNKSDFGWAEEYAAMVSPSCELFLQPEWSRAAQMTPLIVEYVKMNPRWKISLQIHKYMNIP